MSTIEIKHGDAVVTVHRRTPRSDMKKGGWNRRAYAWLTKNFKDYDVSSDDLWMSFLAWSNLASRITVQGDIPIPLPNGHEDAEALRATFDAYLDMEDTAGIELVDRIAMALRELDQPFDDALAPSPPDDPEKKASGKRGSKT